MKLLLEGFMQISLKKKFASTMSFNDLRSFNNFNNSDSVTTKDNSNHSRDKNFVVEMLENEEND